MSNIVSLATDMYPLLRARTTNSTDSAFPSRVPTITTPSGDGVMNVRTTFGAGGKTPNCLQVMPFGRDTNNQTFDLRVVGWKMAGDPTAASDGTRVWMPIPLCEVAVTLSSTQLGVSGKYVTNSDYFADTIANPSTNWNDSAFVSLVSPGQDIPGHFVVDLKGCELVEFLFKRGTATQCNALVSGV